MRWLTLGKQLNLKKRSGNLVSCKNWENFWLNEGLTVFFEMDTLRKMKGEDDYRIRA